MRYPLRYRDVIEGSTTHLYSKPLGGSLFTNQYYGMARTGFDHCPYVLLSKVSCSK